MKSECKMPEQVEQDKKCETVEERLEPIQENGIELSDEQLVGITGGSRMPRSAGYVPQSVL
jgi:hypothetical protein